MRRTTMPMAAVLAALALVAAACGSEGGEGTGAADDGAPTSTEAEAAEGTEFTYVATEFAFDGPESLPAGDLTLTLDNQGEQEHEMAVVELLDGRTIADVHALLKKGVPKKPPQWAREVGGTGADPGETGELEARFTPGTYVLLCFVPDKATKKPHVLHGMLMEVTVG